MLLRSLARTDIIQMNKRKAYNINTILLVHGNPYKKNEDPKMQLELNAYIPYWTE